MCQNDHCFWIFSSILLKLNSFVGLRNFKIDHIANLHMPGQEHLYFIIHKPFKVLSQFTDENNNPGLGTLYDLPKNVYPVGRLDLDSEGLLILSNDKKLNDRLLNPKYLHARTYRIEVEGVPEANTLKKLEKGVSFQLKGKTHKSRPCKVRLLQDFRMPERTIPVHRKKHPVTSWLEISLTEGKNRQVRRMLAAVGHPVLRLIRVAIEDLRLGDLPPGEITQISGKTIYKKLKINSLANV